MIDGGEVGRINEYGRIIRMEGKKDIKETEKGKKTERNETKTEEKDKLIISDANKISDLLKLMKNIPEVREDIVTKFAQMIENGEYKIDLDKLVDAIFKEVYL